MKLEEIRKREMERQKEQQELIQEQVRLLIGINKYLS